MKRRLPLLLSSLALLCADPVLAGDGRLIATGGATSVEGAAGGGLIPWAVISGYSEQGSTTTPWMMLQLNECDRYSLAERAIKMVVDNFNGKDNNIKGEEKRYRLSKVVSRAHEKISWFQHTSKKMQEYAYKTQQDAPEIGQVGTLTEG